MIRVNLDRGEKMYNCLAEPHICAHEATVTLYCQRFKFLLKDSFSLVLIRMKKTRYNPTSFMPDKSVELHVY